jgi:hypothetical protein
LNLLFGLLVQGFWKRLIWSGEIKLLLTIGLAHARFHYLTAKHPFVNQKRLMQFSSLQIASLGGRTMNCYLAKKWLCLTVCFITVTQKAVIQLAHLGF